MTPYIPSTASSPRRRRLPTSRKSITHRFVIEGQKGYFTCGLYEDGTPGELFIRISKEGSTLSGMMDAFSLMVSLALQYGVPLNTMVTKLTNMHFEPCGKTENPDIPFAQSIVDYIFKWMEKRFGKAS